MKLPVLPYYLLQQLQAKIRVVKFESLTKSHRYTVNIYPRLLLLAMEMPLPATKVNSPTSQSLPNPLARISQYKSAVAAAKAAYANGNAAKGVIPTVFGNRIFF